MRNHRPATAKPDQKPPKRAGIDAQKPGSPNPTPHNTKPNPPSPPNKQHNNTFWRGFVGFKVSDEGLRAVLGEKPGNRKVKLAGPRFRV